MHPCSPPDFRRNLLGLGQGTWLHVDLTILYQVCKFVQGSVLLQNFWHTPGGSGLDFHNPLYLLGIITINYQKIGREHIYNLSNHAMVASGWFTNFRCQLLDEQNIERDRPHLCISKERHLILSILLNIFPFIHSLLFKTYIKKSEMPKVPTKEPDSFSLTLGSQIGTSNESTLLSYSCFIALRYIEFWFLCNFYLQYCVAACSNKFSLNDTVQIMYVK